ncbi:theta defensin subunit A-like [Sapajus apella]|uniref:Theta defensin subunit A-like n=1 Tax=Sapajus apella TaxID=9515 RepID=A0A6J3HGY3_SAPAP|nr:theta defensin subunit A-like [Sapajus apella]
MRTLALLAAAVLLVVLRAQAEPLQARADELAAQEQPGADAEEASVSFAWDEGAARQLSGSGRGARCVCRGVICFFGERPSGFCGFLRLRCCR